MSTDVLMIDDEAELVSSTLEYLAAFGVTGHGLGSAEEALAWLVSHDARLLLLDVNLPGASGFELCRTLRATSQTPIIFVSARSSEDDEIMALMLGGDDYLRKPSSLGVLLAKVRRTLERGSAPSEGYDDGHLRFDEAADRFFVDGIPLDLTAREHRLLRHMVTNPERVLTKQELFEQVWGDSITGDGTLSVHIRRLRTRIEPDLDQRRYIQTLWGRGYLFRDRTTCRAVSPATERLRGDRRLRPAVTHQRAHRKGTPPTQRSARRQPGPAVEWPCRRSGDHPRLRQPHCPVPGGGRAVHHPVRRLPGGPGHRRLPATGARSPADGPGGAGHLGGGPGCRDTVHPRAAGRPLQQCAGPARDHRLPAGGLPTDDRPAGRRGAAAQCGGDGAGAGPDDHHDAATAACRAGSAFRERPFPGAAAHPRAVCLPTAGPARFRDRDGPGAGPGASTADQCPRRSGHLPLRRHDVGGAGLRTRGTAGAVGDVDHRAGGTTHPAASARWNCWADPSTGSGFG